MVLDIIVGSPLAWCRHDECSAHGHCRLCKRCQQHDALAFVCREISDCDSQNSNGTGVNPSRLLSRRRIHRFDGVTKLLGHSTRLSSRFLGQRLRSMVDLCSGVHVSDLPGRSCGAGFSVRVRKLESYCLSHASLYSSGGFWC